MISNVTLNTLWAEEEEVSALKAGHCNRAEQISSYGIKKLT